MKNHCYRITATEDPTTNLQFATFNSINHPDRPDFAHVEEFLKTQPLTKGQKLILTIEKVSIRECHILNKQSQ